MDDDSVFAVKDSLLVDFVPREGDPHAQLELKYDVYLVPTEEVGGSGDALLTNGLSAGI